MKFGRRSALYLLGVIAPLGLSVGLVLTAGAQTPTGTTATGSPTAVSGSPTAAATSPTAAATRAATTPTVGAAGAAGLPGTGTGTGGSSNHAVEYGVLAASVLGALALGGGLIATARRR